jgi:hypothetical protein
MANIFNPIVQNSLNLPVRNAWIEIYKLDEKAVEKIYYFEKLEGLDIKFTAKNVGYVFPRVNISVCNLKQENIDYLMNYFNVYTVDNIKKVIRLYIGYNNVKQCIFEGNVINTRLSSPPDMFFEFEAIYRCDALYNNVQISLTNEVTIKQAYQAVAEKLGMELDWQASSQKKVSSFVCDCSANKMLNDIDKLDDTISMYILGTFSGENNGVIRVMDNVYKVDDYKKPAWQQTHVINARTGLYGVPQFDCYGAKISCMLNPNIQMNDIVELTSLYQKSGNGKYIVSSVTHSGELRGNNFKTDLILYALYGRKSDSSTRSEAEYVFN